MISTLVIDIIAGEHISSKLAARVKQEKEHETRFQALLEN